MKELDGRNPGVTNVLEPPGKEDEVEKAVSIVLADGYELILRGLRRILESEDIKFVGDRTSAEEVFSEISRLQPNKVLTDAQVPEMNGTKAIHRLKRNMLDLTRRITKRSPQPLVIVLTPYEDESQLLQIIKAGAVAYSSKNIAADELADVSRRASWGKHVITENLLTKPKVAERGLKRFQDLCPSLDTPLTSRELEVLTYVARGCGNKRIAYTLNISEQTIKNHISSILRKLDANDRTHAVVLAMRHGWIPIAEREEAIPKH